MPLSRNSRPTVLLTGFGRFPGVPVNASGVLAGRLAAAARRRFPGVAFRSAVLPTEWDAAPRRLARLLAQTRPVVALHFGVSDSVRGFSVETIAHNVRAAVADAAGCSPGSACVVEPGPDALACTIPARRIVARLQELAIPAGTSDDAGRYLCNSAFYHSLYRARRGDHRSIAGFIHIPTALIDAGHAPAPGSPLGWGQALAGGLEIIAASLDEVGAGSSTRVDARAGTKGAHARRRIGRAPLPPGPPFASKLRQKRGWFG